jgi:hypothetical protein
MGIITIISCTPKFPIYWAGPPAGASVSLDYLVGEGINASFDKKTLQRLQEIESMNPDFKKHLFSIIDSVIRDYKTQQAYA